MPNVTSQVPGTSKTYLQATLKDGTTVVSSFEKLANVQKYAATIFARLNVFNAWQLVARVHPTSGEACLVRRRRMISGDQITEIERVIPISFAEFARTIASPTEQTESPAALRERYENAIANYDPSAFESALEIQAGDGGIWIAPTENTPVGAVAGQRYPVHVDATSLARFVILHVATDAAAEIRFQLEANRATRETTIDEITGGRVVDGPTDGDEDVDEDEINHER
jgi:hypothetical protein